MKRSRKRLCIVNFNAKPASEHLANAIPHIAKQTHTLQETNSKTETHGNKVPCHTGVKLAFLWFESCQEQSRALRMRSSADLRSDKISAAGTSGRLALDLERRVHVERIVRGDHGRLPLPAAQAGGCHARLQHLQDARQGSVSALVAPLSKAGKTPPPRAVDKAATGMLHEHVGEGRDVAAGQGICNALA